MNRSKMIIWEEARKMENPIFYAEVCGISADECFDLEEEYLKARKEVQEKYPIRLLEAEISKNISQMIKCADEKIISLRKDYISHRDNKKEFSERKYIAEEILSLEKIKEKLKVYMYITVHSYDAWFQYEDKEFIEKNGIDYFLRLYYRVLID